MKKSTIAAFVSGALLFGTVGVFAGQYVATENPFPVKLNGNNVSLEGYNINDETYFKLRDIADTVGGFSVGFEDNTIQLTKDGYSVKENNNNNSPAGYVFETPAPSSTVEPLPSRKLTDEEFNKIIPISGSSNDNIVYYSEHPWCPDFGAFTGATLKDVRTSESGITFYSYYLDTVNNHTEYYDLILETTGLKLNPASIAAFILFEDLDTGHSVSCSISNEYEIFTVGVE